MTHKENYSAFLNDLNKQIISGKELLEEVDITQWCGWNMHECKKFKLNLSDRELKNISETDNIYPNKEDKIMFVLPNIFPYLGKMSTFGGGFNLTYDIHSNYNVRGFRPNQQETYIFWFTDDLVLKRVEYSHATYREIYQDAEVGFAMRNG